MGYISIILSALLTIPIVSIALIKLYYLKKYNKILTSTISKVAVGLGYITGLTVLIDFIYKDFFLIAALGMAYLTMVNFMLKSSKKK